MRWSPLFLCFPALAQTAPVQVTIDASKTGAPISKNIYGQFLEHGGNIVNENIWAEMLEDRKFYRMVNSKAPEQSVSPGGRLRPPTPLLGTRRAATMWWSWIRKLLIPANTRHSSDLMALSRVG